MREEPEALPKAFLAIVLLAGLMARMLGFGLLAFAFSLGFLLELTSSESFWVLEDCVVSECPSSEALLTTFAASLISARTAASFLRAKNSCNLISNSGFGDNTELQGHGTSDLENKDNPHDKQGWIPDFQFPFGDWFSPPWSNQQQQHQSPLNTRDANSTSQGIGKSSSFLPKITMVGVSTGEPGKMSKSTLKKTMDDLTRELERVERGNQVGSVSSEDMFEERDPLFVANVGDYYSSAAKTGSVRWVRGGSS